MSLSGWMQRCLALAARSRGRTAPNPMVGALVVANDEIVGEGWHHAAGRPHAEVEALRAAGPLARGATMVVNLEPCCHHGRTPPCIDAILDAGITRVVVGMVDPDPRMQGRAITLLRAAGLEVVTGICEADCQRLNRAYVIAKTQDRPMVVLKAGLSLDGRIASAAGESRWITGDAAREAGHRLRDIHDAIMVGSGTLLADDPALNTRIEGGRDARPVLLDSGLQCPEQAKVLDAGREPIVYCAEDAPARSLRAEVVRVPRTESGVDLDAVFSDMVQRGILSVLVEGGGRVHHSLLSRGCVDRVHLFIAPMVLAGGQGWVAGRSFSLAGAPRMQVREVRTVGEDIHVVLDAKGES